MRLGFYEICTRNRKSITFGVDLLSGAVFVINMMSVILLKNIIHVEIRFQKKLKWKL